MNALRGGAEDRAQALAREQQEPLLAVLTRELSERGYVRVEGGDHQGGVWRSPDGAVDHLVPMLVDCLDREDA